MKSAKAQGHRGAARPKFEKAAVVSNKVKSDDPLYVQIARDLKADIIGGVYPVGSLIPTEDKLSRHYSVSRYTVREALRRLRADNLISSRRGAGTIVVPPQSSDSNFVHAMSINDVLSFSRRWVFTITSIKMDALNKGLRSWLGLAKGDKWLAVRGVGRTKGAELPECWVEFFINKEFASVGRLLRSHHGPLLPLLEDMYGQTVVELKQDITAALIPADMAAELQVEPGTPAIVVRRSCTTAEGKIVECNIETYPAPRFRYTLTLHRGKTASRH